MNGRVTGYGWDATGNLTSIAYPDSAGTVTRNFDDAGRFTSILDWSGRTTTFGYDGDGNWTSTVFPKPGGTANTDAYTYDAAGQMTSASWWQGVPPAPQSTAGLLGSETYTRPTSKKGMIDTTAVTGTAGTGSKTNDYDSRDRLTAAGAESFTLDGASNLTKGPGGRLQVFDPAQQLCWTSATATSGTCATPPADATTYSSDERGNRTGMQPASGVGSTYGFDQANRMTSAKVPSELGGDGQLKTFGVARLLDTRGAGTGSCSPSPCARLGAGSTTTVNLAGQGPVPASNVDAVWATVTVINPSASGYVRINKNAAGTASAVTLNFDAATNRNETAIIPLVGGSVTLTATTGVDVVLDVTGYFEAAGTPGDTYRSSTPTRLVDTRNGTGVCDGVPCATPAANHTTMVTAQGQGGLPASGVHAAVVSLTVVNPTVAGQIKVAPGAGGGGAATINFVAGQTLNETVIAPVDANGKVAVWTGPAVDFVIDVSGYFTPPVAGNLGLAYQPLTPTRLVDSRTPTGPCVGGACAPLVNSVRQRVKVAGNAGVPASASAVVGTLTLVNPVVDGFVRLNPTLTSGMGLGGDETVNVNAGKTRNSVVLVPLKADGTVEIVSNSGTDWILDISGYMAQPAGTWTYQYDTAGTRSAKVSPAGVTTQFAYSSAPGLPMLLEQVTGTEKTFVIYGPGDQPVEQINSDGTTWWLHHDQLGSVRLATLSTTGSTVSSRAFNAYGTTKTQTGTQPLLGYNGQYHDTETGFVYLRARYYDPQTGVFVNADPAFPLTGSPYAYAGGSPTSYADPSGLFIGQGMLHKAGGFVKKHWKGIAKGLAVAALVAAVVAFPVGIGAAVLVAEGELAATTALAVGAGFSATSTGLGMIQTKITCDNGSKDACTWSKDTTLGGGVAGMIAMRFPFLGSLIGIGIAGASFANPHFDECRTGAGQERGANRNPDGSTMSGGISDNEDEAGVPLDPTMVRHP